LYIATCHSTLLGVEAATGRLRQVKTLPLTDGRLLAIDVPDGQVARLEATQASAHDHIRLMNSGPLADCDFVRTADHPGFLLHKDGLFAGAEQHSDAIPFDRTVARDWEIFRFVSHETAMGMVTPILKDDAFADAVRTLSEQGEPVCLQFGCGPRLIDGFLNVDKFTFLPFAPNYFNFDFAERAWPIPDACVDYIYSEDFIEHIPQKNQLAFLAESFRVLKPGGFNRVNTPCLLQAMTKSNFAKGFAGFYFAEYDNWQHIALFTQDSLREAALMIGYRHAFFTAKSRGTSPFAVADLRPGDDRDDLIGNIFADLLK